MRDHEKKSRALAARESPRSATANAPAPPSAPVLSPADWIALPLSVRASERLAAMLLALQAIETDLSTDEAADLRWIEPTIREVGTTVSDTLKVLAS
jgi:hypothetical protein